jgi:hypothetical protein
MSVMNSRCFIADSKPKDQAKYSRPRPCTAAKTAALVRFGSWLCRNAWEREEFAFLAAFASGVLHFLRSDYALIAAMRGWMPMMFITRVRL